MQVIVEKKSGWRYVVDAARFTQGKGPLGHEPSDEFKRRSLLSEHSPIRELEYVIRLRRIPHYVAMHLVRYNAGVNKYVATSRPDIRGEVKPRSQQRKDDPVDVMFTMNAQAIMLVSRQRLCSKAEHETRRIWVKVVHKIKALDPILAEKCVPNCVYRGFCPEREPCGISDSRHFCDQVERFRRVAVTEK